MRSLTIAIPIILGLIGCGSSSSAPTLPEATATPSTIAPGSMSQQFRVVNGSPGTGAVDVYLHIAGAVRPVLPAFANVPFGGITPYVREGVTGTYVADFLRAGALSTSPAIASFSQYSVVLQPSQIDSMNRTLVISGTNLNGTRNVQYFSEPFEPAGRSALVAHHASPAADVFTAMKPIGIGAYSTSVYPPGTASTSITPQATKQLFTLTFVQNPSEVPLPDTPTSTGTMYFLTPFPVAPLPATVGFAVGLPSTSAVTNAPLAGVIANAALSETANENYPYAGQNALTNDALETVPPGTHISEFLIDADQNGNVGLIGTIDP